MTLTYEYTKWETLLLEAFLFLFKVQNCFEETRLTVFGAQDERDSKYDLLNGSGH